MSSNDDHMKKLLGTDLASVRAAAGALDPFSEAMRAASAGSLAMDEIARQQRLMDQLVSPHTQATKALIDIHNTASLLATADTSRTSALKSIYDPISVTGIDASNSILTHQDAIRRAVMGPLADLRESGALTTITSREAMLATRALTDYEDQFRRATSADIRAIAVTANYDHLLATRYRDDILEVAKAATYPFVRVDAAAASVQAFAELQGLSRGLVALAPYADELTRSLRFDLGDWRGLAAAPLDVYPDISVRTTFYVDQGVRSELTDFPAEAFDAALPMGAVQRFSLTEEFGNAIDAPEDEDPTEFERTNEMQGALHRYERRMRTLIHQRMSKAHGPDWPRLKLQPQLYQDWKGKSEKAAAAGKPDGPLILFADFTHYETIICNRGNWPLFQDAFGTADSTHIKESFFRLQLPRLEVFHGRMLTRLDYLLLYAELTRMNKALNASRS